MKFARDRRSSLESKADRLHADEDGCVVDRRIDTRLTVDRRIDTEGGSNDETCRKIDGRIERRVRC